MRKKGTWVTGSLLFVLYFFLFPSPSGKNLYFLALEARDLGKAKQKALHQGGKRWAISLGKWFGYLDDHLAMENFAHGRDIAAYSDTLYLEYSQGEKKRSSLLVRNPQGELLGSIEKEGIPIVHRERILIRDPIAGTLSEWRKEGTLVWERARPSLLTSLAVTGAHLVVGYLDGRVIALDPEGVNIGEYRSGGSRIHATYGVAVSPTGRLIAVITGLDPQRFVLLGRRGVSYRPLVHFDVEEQARHPVWIHFSEEADRVYFEGQGRIDLYDIVGQKRQSLPSHRGTIEQVAEEKHLRLFLLLTRTKTRGALRIFRKEGRESFTFPLKSETLSLRLQERRIILGVGQTLLLIDMGES